MPANGPGWCGEICWTSRSCSSADTLDAPRVVMLRNILRPSGHKLDAAIEDLGIDPSDDQLLNLLQEKIEMADSWLHSISRPDLAAAVKQNDSAAMTARLLSARVPRRFASMRIFRWREILMLPRRPSKLARKANLPISAMCWR